VGVVSAEALAVRELLARRPEIKLTFVQHRTSGKVHVEIPPDPDVEPITGPPSETGWVGWVIEDVRSLCGYVARILIGNDRGGDKIVEQFDDLQLCWRCHDALGEHSDRAFEHPLPDAAVEPAPGEGS
jgi:hypothetical protein